MAKNGETASPALIFGVARDLDDPATLEIAPATRQFVENLQQVLGAGRVGPPTQHMGDQLGEVADRHNALLLTPNSVEDYLAWHAAQTNGHRAHDYMVLGAHVENDTRNVTVELCTPHAGTSVGGCATDEGRLSFYRPLIIGKGEKAQDTVGFLHAQIAPLLAFDWKHGQAEAVKAVKALGFEAPRTIHPRPRPDRTTSPSGPARRVTASRAGRTSPHEPVAGGGPA